ncbi:MAG: VacJ family lipoprotein [Succinatimonas sp.]|jgi:phospholipid-binding lipoprotein MlaA|nr:VacJ family lipoprotein [Succinatimonas sp.]MDY5722593.1 VacJ family lipoprotein [Succinivibrio sp.]
MLKTIIKSTLAVTALFSFAQTVNAAHSTYSPMAPRQLSVKASHADYSYGLSILPGNSIDSIEVLNRNVFWRGNYLVFDRYLLRPVAHAYAKLPNFAKDGVHNFFSNISDLNNTVNNPLVGRFKDSSISISRFTINSTLGLLGLIDVAKHMGLEQKSMSMNTVLGKAGVDQGEYFMLPALGPTTERNIHGSLADSWTFAPFNVWTSAALHVVEAIDIRARLIDQEELIDKSVDPYAQMRQIYLMYQEGQVNPEASMEVKKDENVEEFLDEIDG